MSSPSVILKKEKREKGKQKAGQPTVSPPSPPPKNSGWSEFSDTFSTATTTSVVPKAMPPHRINGTPFGQNSDPDSSWTGPDSSDLPPTARAAGSVEMSKTKIGACGMVDVPSVVSAMNLDLSLPGLPIESHRPPR
ncbi:hypothetical protein M413DRAFT_32751 [Hebeloma cylindrosporum]|uniref:Uncharacterized protein n=1 Tax=Hebeloma cylindrosporum TaxID=76867 RepID=A0A0C2XAZ6_HEBCY|nr:hypothetical protein M413DRAFT_32751 [Hebeloma cylindrosporum h7]